MNFIGLLTLIFVTLKLVGVIDWTWWWVLSPPLCVIAFVLFISSGVVVAKWRKGRW